jgi:hypothetical protein
MINSLRAFYTLESNPLIVPEELNVDFMYANEHGDIIKIIDIRNITVDIDSEPEGHMAIDYNILQKSELVDGENLSGLTEKQLSLFWRLTRNNASKTIPYEDDTDKD